MSFRHRSDAEPLDPEDCLRWSLISSVCARSAQARRRGSGPILSASGAGTRFVGGARNAFGRAERQPIGRHIVETAALGHTLGEGGLVQARARQALTAHRQDFAERAERAEREDFQVGERVVLILEYFERVWPAS